MHLEIYTLSQDYIDYLGKFEDKICWTKGDLPFGRKYVGVLLNINNTSYFAPLTSSIWSFDKITGNKFLKKHFTDVYLEDEKETDIYKRWLGAVKINNMIPIDIVNHSDLLTELRIDKFVNSKKLNERLYGILLRKQRSVLNTSEVQNSILIKAKNFRRDYKLNPSLNKLCCNFELLEQKALEYKQVKNKEIEMSL